MAAFKTWDLSFERDGYATENFGNQMMQRMFNFYKEGELTDFQIKVDNKIFNVHKLVMASSSDYFRAMLSHDMLETRQDFAEMKGLTAKGTEPLIEYAYSGKLSLTLDNIQEVLAGAMFLQMSTAENLCIQFLMEKMNFENAEDLLNIGEMFSISCIKDYYRKYILDNFLQFVETKTFLRLDTDTLADYLSDDSLQTTSEAALLHHALKWYNYDKSNREHCVHDVLDKVRLTIDGWPTVHFASQIEPFISNPECRELIQFAETFMQNAERRYLINSHRTRVRCTRKTIVQFGGVMRYDNDIDQYRIPLLTDEELFGYSENHFFHLDLKSWFPLGCIAETEKKSHTAMVEVNDDFGVLIGGYEYEVDSDSVGLVHAVRDVKMFSAQGDPSLWDMKPLQHERARHAAVYLSGCIYVMGGKDDRQSLSSVEKLDCDKGKWTYVRLLPHTLYDHAAAVCNDKIYIAGGVFKMDVTKNVWCYTTHTDKWKKVDSLNSARAGHKMVCINDKLYTCGGYSTTHSRVPQCLKSMEMYNPSTNKWTKISKLQHDLAHFEMIVLNNKILVLGGVDSSGELTQYIHEYDPSLDQWCLFGELPRTLRNLSCCAVKMKLTDIDLDKEERDSIIAEYTRQWDIDTDCRDVEGLT